MSGNKLSSEALRYFAGIKNPPRVDFVVIPILFFVSVIVFWNAFGILSFTFDKVDIWFDTDSNFVIKVLTDRWSIEQSRNNLHPIYSLFNFPIIYGQTHLLGLSAQDAVRVLVTGTAAAYIATFYATLRLVGRPVAIALLFTSILAASCSTMVSAAILERHIEGGITVLACIAAVAAYERGLISAKWLVAAAIAAFGVTITNYTIGVIALFLCLGFWRGVQANVNVVFVITVFTAVTMYLFPPSPPFFHVGALPFGSTSASIGKAVAGTAAERATVLVAHSVVWPTPRIASKPPPNETTLYSSVQRVGLQAHGPVGLAALAAWFAILALAIWGLARTRPLRKVDLLIVIGIVSQFALFQYFGSEVLLFSPYYTPLLVLLASYALARPTRWTYGLCVVFLGLLAWNNAEQFGVSVAMARSLL